MGQVFGGQLSMSRERFEQQFGISPDEKLETKKLENDRKEFSGTLIYKWYLIGDKLMGEYTGDRSYADILNINEDTKYIVDEINLLTIKNTTNVNIELKFKFNCSYQSTMADTKKEKSYSFSIAKNLDIVGSANVCRSNAGHYFLSNIPGLEATMLGSGIPVDRDATLLSSGTKEPNYVMVRKDSLFVDFLRRNREEITNHARQSNKMAIDTLPYKLMDTNEAPLFCGVEKRAIQETNKYIFKLLENTCYIDNTNSSIEFIVHEDEMKAEINRKTVPTGDGPKKLGECQVIVHFQYYVYSVSKNKSVVPFIKFQ